MCAMWSRRQQPDSGDSAHLQSPQSSRGSWEFGLNHIVSVYHRSITVRLIYEAGSVALGDLRLESSVYNYYSIVNMYEESSLSSQLQFAP